MDCNFIPKRYYEASLKVLIFASDPDIPWENSDSATKTSLSSSSPFRVPEFTNEVCFTEDTPIDESAETFLLPSHIHQWLIQRQDLHHLFSWDASINGRVLQSLPKGRSFSEPSPEI